MIIWWCRLTNNRFIGKGNGIGVEGAKILGNALKYNSFLTQLDLAGMKTIDLLILWCRWTNNWLDWYREWYWCWRRESIGRSTEIQLLSDSIGPDRYEGIDFDDLMMQIGLIYLYREWYWCWCWRSERIGRSTET